MNYKYIILLSSLFLLNACSVTQFHYSSNAEVQHYTKSTETEMNVVLNDSNNMRSYGVITAVDNRQTQYLLIAPKPNLMRSPNNEISNFNITEASYIDLQAAQEFRSALSRISSEWDNLGDDDGYFYEFSSVPETDVVQIAEETFRFAPSIRFFFNVTDEGSTGELIIEYINYRTNETVIRSIDFNSKEKIDDLRDLLAIGLSTFS